VRVCVIGAGLAGLAAADALNHAGAEVVVFEARDRVGGRVHTRRLANDALVEMGAEFFEDEHRCLHDLVKRFALGVVARDMRYSEREPRGVSVTADQVRAGAERVRAALREHPQARSVPQLLDLVDLDEAVREAILARVEVSTARAASDVDAHHLAGFASGFGGAESRRIVEGNQALALGLAAALGDAVRLATPVRGVSVTPTGVDVATAEGEAHADAVVVAVPAAALSRIAFEPGLPPGKRGALDRVATGEAAKLFVPLAAPAAPSAVISVPERYWCWTARDASGQVAPVVSCYAGSAPALARLRIETGPGQWLASLRDLRPDLSLDEDDALISRWDDEWTGGAFTVPGPGQAPGDQEALRARVGRIVFCGEYTAGELAGLMEGALASGLRAAAELAET
jgi:monoamine oxidase